MYVEICVRLFFSLYFIEIVSRCILVFVHLVPIVSTELRVYLSLFACFRSYFLSCVCVFFGRLPHIPLKVCYLMEVSEGIHGKQYFCVSALQDFFWFWHVMTESQKHAWTWWEESYPLVNVDIANWKITIYKR